MQRCPARAAFIRGVLPPSDSCSWSTESNGNTLDKTIHNKHINKQTARVKGATSYQVGAGLQQYVRHVRVSVLTRVC